jgi:hypothetical protein
MSRLPVLMFAAAIAIWGLASIPDGSGNDRISPAYRRGELARTSDRAFLTPTQKAAASACARRALTLVAPWPEVASLFDQCERVAPRHILAMIYEPRGYQPVADQTPKLLARLRDHTVPIAIHVIIVGG